MSQDEEIRLDLKSNTAEGEAARRKLDEIDAQVIELKSSFAQGQVQTARYNQELKSLERQADRARASLAKVQPAGRLTGVDRSSAMSRGALLGANTLQDMIQGGPASGINNILGAANDRGIKALGVEAIAAAGGLGMVSAAFATVAVAAGAAYVLIGNGLKEAKLDWSDFDDVIGNTHVWRAASETASGYWELIKSDVKIVAGLVEATHPQLTMAREFLDEYVIGWDQATDAARNHKAEVERGLNAVRDYVEASKELDKVKSTAQKAVEERGKNTLDQIAELGGERGLEGVADKLAGRETRTSGKDKDGKDRMVKVPKLDRNGNADGEEEITVREQSRRRFVRELGAAGRGDPAALSRLLPQLNHAGFDTSKINGRDPKKDAAKAERMREAEEDAARDLAETDKADKKARADKAERMREAEEDAARDLAETDKADKKNALDSAEKATAGTGLGGRIDDALLREALKSGGAPGVAKKAVADQIAAELRGRGLSEEDARSAANDLAEKHAARLGDEINDRAAGGGDKARDLTTPQRIGTAEFARSVESAGAADSKKMLTLTEQMKSYLSDIVSNTRGGGVVGP